MEADELLIGHLEVIPPPASASTVSRVPPFLDFDERCFEDEIAVREDVDEVHKFLEQRQDAAAFRAQSPAERRAVLGIALDQVLADDQRFDDEHLVLVEQSVHFPANGGEGPVLDFDQLSTADDIDPEAVQPRFLGSVAGGVELFELSVEGGFHDGMPGESCMGATLPGAHGIGGSR